MDGDRKMYPLAADHPERVGRLVLVEAVVPGLAAPPPLIMPGAGVDRLFHFAFNRPGSLNEELVAGRERLFFGHQFATKAVRPLPGHAIAVHVAALARDRDALRASFGPYRAIDETVAQNTRRRGRRLRMPVLTVAGDRSVGDALAESPAPVVEDLTAVVLPGCGHYPAEEMLAAVVPFIRQG